MADWWIAITAMVGVVWWIVWGWFVYIPTNSSDTTMQSINWTSGTYGSTVPLAWFWTNLAHPTIGYTAIHYLMVFLMYLIVGVLEFIFWMMYILEADGGAYLFNLWASYVGLYGSWILYILTWVFMAVELGRINGNIYLPGYINAIVQMTMFLLTWLGTGLVHVFYYDDLNAKLEPIIACEEAAKDCSLKQNSEESWREYGCRCLAFSKLGKNAAPVAEVVVEDAAEAENKVAVEEGEAEPDAGADW